MLLWQEHSHGSFHPAELVHPPRVSGCTGPYCTLSPLADWSQSPWDPSLTPLSDNPTQNKHRVNSQIIDALTYRPPKDMQQRFRTHKQTQTVKVGLSKCSGDKTLLLKMQGFISIEDITETPSCLMIALFFNQLCLFSQKLPRHQGCLIRLWRVLYWLKMS